MNTLKDQLSEMISETPTVQAMTAAEHAELVALRAENAQLRQAKANAGSVIKVTEKGGVAVYGLGRFPVTLYKSQWDKLLGMTDQIKAFIEANQHLLSEKAKADTAETSSRATAVEQILAKA